MNNRVIYSIVIGAALYIAIIAMHVLTSTPELNPILFIIPAFIIGIIVSGVKRGFLLSFVLTFIFVLLGSFILSSETLRAASNPNVAAAFVIIFVIYAAIAGALGAVGGFIGSKVFKK